MIQYVRNFQKFRPLLGELVMRDVKIKYRKSVLGVLWTLLNPLLMMAVLSIVFSHLLRFNVENYPVYILSGQVMYNFFSEATSSAMTSILNNAPLIKKVYIPKYLFTFARIASSVINIMASFAALILVMVFMRMELHYTLFLGDYSSFLCDCACNRSWTYTGDCDCKIQRYHAFIRSLPYSADLFMSGYLSNDIFVRRIPDLYDCKFESADNHYEYVP
mgnify:FL=1